MLHCDLRVVLTVLVPLGEGSSDDSVQSQHSRFGSNSGFAVPEKGFRRFGSLHRAATEQIQTHLTVFRFLVLGPLLGHPERWMDCHASLWEKGRMHLLEIV